ncbi:MAG: threonyl-tRNA synthetase [Microgenomates group bacterium Gr01-1014_16]|nr:MAG: threonyl-tRNA synthetase [Microgenomates group bacterium Gr01-1014_16]
MDQNLDDLRHSCAHLLAAAVMDLYPKALRTIGPAIENGFYYDFDNLKISDSDLPAIEAKMHEIAKSWIGFERIGIDNDQAIKQFSHNPYKLELIEEYKDQDLTLYKSGEFVDLCRGGHVEHPDKELKHFKLLSIAGAYWRGDEKNKMLTRIYGTCWPTQGELDKYLWQQEEAKKRDHKKLGPSLELFMFHETAPGMPYWLPKGVILYNELIKFWREEHSKKGYQEIVSPILNKKELYITSGHYDHYWEDMFVAKTADEGEYGVKAMNCPNAHIVFGSKTRSYRDLPLRLSDTDTLHRYERSGTLNGLLRVREFRQDDAHIYVSEDQVEPEYKEVFEIVKRFYSIFGMEYAFRLGTRNPDNFMGDIETWNKAESTLKTILEHSEVDYSILEGDGAFYGPKVDILMKDALGRSWQMGTVQLDFQQPRRFKLQYTDNNGQPQTPIAIHRVVYGSLERFIGILIEHFGGAFPTWLSPVQVVVLPISDKHLDYAKKVESQLKSANIRVELNEKSEPLNARVRDAEMQKVPYILVVGDREAASDSVSVRRRGTKESNSQPVSEFISQISHEISARANTSTNTPNA